MSTNTCIHSSPHQTYWKQACDPQAELMITIYLRSKPVSGENANTYATLLMQHPGKRSYLTNKDCREKMCVDDKALQAVESFAKHFDLKIIEQNILQKSVSLKATIDQFSRTFGVCFSICQTEGGQQHLNYDGRLIIPAFLDQYVLSISGLHSGLIEGHRSSVSVMDQHSHADKGYTPQQVESVYEFPENDAEGQCIGLIELGGRYLMSDIEAYCKHFGIPVPEIIEVGGIPESDKETREINDLEVTMDLQLAAGLAPKAKLVIYYAKSIPDAIHLAINDDENNPSVLSVSWALSEYDCSIAKRQHLDELCYQAALKGITVVAASGDYGAYNKKSFPNVMLPAANPYVLGCGGTALYLPSGYEQVWYNEQLKMGSGGGYSAVYNLPHYQSGAVLNYKRNYFPYPVSSTGRGVPDLAANAAGITAYAIVWKGSLKKMGAGTSASTPVFAALIARLNKESGYNLGSLHEFLYRLGGSGVFKQVVQGSNGLYPAAPGWNPATGLGVVLGKQLSKALENSKSYY